MNTVNFRVYLKWAVFACIKERVNDMNFDIYDKIALVLIIAFCLISTINMPQLYELIIKSIIVFILIINVIVKLVNKN